jgi:DNA topoisomerase-1
MAKQAKAGTRRATSSGNGTALVIVESPAKARTISKFLGKDFTVEASIGHIRDLPKSARELPKEYKGTKWAYLGVNVEDNFTPVYIIPSDKKTQVNKLKELLKKSRELYLATDEDREGEAISWHLCEVLKPKVPIRRLVFHEITEEAIREALTHPRGIDEGLVRAQETRRILDRLYGYEVSQLLWRKVGPKLSAGRVQSVTVRMIVERERQRMAFRAATWWDLVGQFATPDEKTLEAGLVSVDGRRIPSGRDFDPQTGTLKDPQLLLLDEAGVQALAERLRRLPFRVTNVEEKPYIRKPPEPFTTSTLQQEANRKLGYSARRTMDIAQSLYEEGHITYMRTDSTSLAQVAIDAARDLVRTEYGPDYLPPSPRIYRSKVRNAQEAHEAIRPAGHPFELPSAMKAVLPHDQFRLFDLIWKRTIASQMVEARGRIVTITIEADGAVFQVSGKTIDFPGFLRAYVEGSDDPEAELADQERILPAVAIGQELRCLALNPKSHTTQPPPRFSEASLTAALEERGIGRPSTYATIIETILDRQYVFKKGNALVPTWTAFTVCRLLEEHLPNLVDYEFTAQMEDFLDRISRHEAEHLSYLKEFYFGNEHPGLKQQLDSKLQEIDARDLSRFPLGTPEQGPRRETVYVRLGKFGPFLEQGDRKASIPQDLPPDELTLAKALELLDQASASEQPLGHDPQTGQPVFLKQGRFGPYVQLGSGGEGQKPKSASLLPGMQPQDVTLETALQLLELPKTLGTDPASGQPVVVSNGRFGPYVQCGRETRSIPPDISPLSITLEEALALLAQPKVRGRGRTATTRQPLRTLENSPVTGQPVRVLAGRYGTYVTDGVTNATLPRDVAVESLTLAQALELLAERAARGSAPRKRRRSAAAARSPRRKKASA